jgi:hypothetical protein
VAYVSGFSSKFTARCFEFAWQHPQKVGFAFQHDRLVKWMKEAYAELRSITKDWVRGIDQVEWNMRVLHAMIVIDKWRSLSLCVHEAAMGGAGEVVPVIAQSPLPAPKLKSKKKVCQPKAKVAKCLSYVDDEVEVVDDGFDEVQVIGGATCDVIIVES